MRTDRLVLCLIILAVQSLALVSIARAESLTVSVTISKIDQENRGITVARKSASGTKTTTFDVSPDAEIQNAGQKATLDNLEPGQKATITYDTKLEIVTKILAEKLEEGAGFVSLFDGKSLNGWEGNGRFWKVKNGVLIGQNSDDSGASFLQTNKTYKNFILRLKFRHIIGNSGINFRSHSGREGRMIGPQAELTEGKLPKWHLAYGILVDEGGPRAVIADMAPNLKSKVIASVRKADWSEIEITADGDHFMIKVNDITTVDLDDDQILPSGVIAFQLKAGTEMEFKDIEIQELPDVE